MPVLAEMKKTDCIWIFEWNLRDKWSENKTKLSYIENVCLNIRHMRRKCSFKLKINYKFLQEKNMCCKDVLVVFCLHQTLSYVVKLQQRNFQVLSTFHSRKFVERSTNFHSGEKLFSFRFAFISEKPNRELNLLRKT